MPKILAIIIELAVAICAIWVISFLSTLLHEMGHALGYLISTGDRHWHIRVGSGKKLLDTRKLTVKLLPIDGDFFPSGEKKIDTKAKLIATLAGGPAVSLILAAILLPVELGGVSLDSEFFSSGAVEFFVNFAFSLNLFILVLSLIPAHYFHGEIKGMPSDGLQIIKTIRDKKSKPDSQEEMKTK